jgi:hypothetical protein
MINNYQNLIEYNGMLEPFTQGINNKEIISDPILEDYKKLTLINDPQINIDLINSNIPNFDTFNNRKYHNPCDKCMNNPKNNPNASGVCHCALPSMYNIIY